MDTDMLKVKYSEKQPKIEEDYVCTLEEELQPPSLRPSIKTLIKSNEERIEKTYKRIPKPYDKSD